MQHKPDFKSAFLALTEEQSTADHPAAEMLAAYHTGDLGGEERAIVHRHLAGCRECAELARDLDLFTEAAEPAAADELEVAACLRKLKPRLTVERSPPPKPAWQTSLALAASLVLVAGASWWLSHTLTQRQMLAELARPRADVQIVDLIEDASQRTGRPAPHGEIRHDAGGVLILTPDLTNGFSGYEVRILDSDGRVAHSIDGVDLDPVGDTVNLWIAAGSLEPGDYGVELYGHAEAGAELVAGYRLRVVGSAATVP